MQNAYNVVGFFTNYNVALGYEAMKGSSTPSNNTGNYNVAVGYQTNWNNTSGTQNSSLGYQALYNNNTGINNTAIGYQALILNGSGSSNTAVGTNALNSTSSNNNTGIGDHAGGNLTSGFNNIVIGSNAQASSSFISNEVTLGNSSNNSYRMYAASWTNASDERLKHDIRDIPAGLDLVKKLRPVEYVYNNANNEERSLGFIAQEVQTALKDSKLVKSGLVTALDETYYGLKTTELIPILTKAIQEQQKEIEELRAMIKKK